MKSKLPLLISLLVFPLVAFAQGTISFNNTGVGVGRIYDVGPVGGTLLNNTNYRVGLYYSLDTNNLSPFSFSGSLLAVTNMSVLPGRFIGGTIPVVGTLPGTYLAAQIRVWFGNFPSYEAMIAAGNYDAFGNCISGECAPRGQSAPFLVGPLNGPPVPLNNLLDFSLNVAPIPEPSSFALAGLAALAFFGPRLFRKPRPTKPDVSSCF